MHMYHQGFDLQVYKMVFRAIPCNTTKSSLNVRKARFFWQKVVISMSAVELFGASCIGIA
jgi:hypothetical protein